MGPPSVAFSLHVFSASVKIQYSPESLFLWKDSWNCKTESYRDNVIRTYFNKVIRTKDPSDHGAKV